MYAPALLTLALTLGSGFSCAKQQSQAPVVSTSPATIPIQDKSPPTAELDFVRNSYNVAPVLSCVPQGKEGTGAHFCEFHEGVNLANGGFALVGTLHGHVKLGAKELRSRGSNNAIVVWTDAEGAVERTALLGRSWDNAIHHVAAGPDASLFVAGVGAKGLHPGFFTEKSPLPSDQRPFVALFRASGELAFLHEANEAIVEIASTANGFVTVGFSGRVQVFDGKGKVVDSWQPDGEQWQEAAAIAIESSSAFWALHYHKRPGEPFYQAKLVATHHQRNGKARAYPLANAVSNSTVYANLVGGQLVVGTTIVTDRNTKGQSCGTEQVPSQQCQSAGLWLLNPEGIVWQAVEPMSTRASNIEETRLRGVTVSSQGVVTLLSDLATGRVSAGTRMLVHDLSTGKFLSVATAEDPAIAVGLHTLIGGGERQILLPREDAIVAMSLGETKLDPTVTVVTLKTH